MYPGSKITIHPNLHPHTSRGKPALHLRHYAAYHHCCQTHHQYLSNLNHPRPHPCPFPHPHCYHLLHLRCCRLGLFRYSMSSHCCHPVKQLPPCNPCTLYPDLSETTQYFGWSNVDNECMCD